MIYDILRKREGVSPAARYSMFQEAFDQLIEARRYREGSHNDSASDSQSPALFITRQFCRLGEGSGRSRTTGACVAVGNLRKIGRRHRNSVIHTGCRCVLRRTW